MLLTSISGENRHPTIGELCKINIQNNYYDNLILRQQVQAQTSMIQDFNIQEITSGTSEPPRVGPENLSGGTEVPEVNSMVNSPEVSSSDMHRIVLKEILEIIRERNGSDISFIAAIEYACSRNELVRNYLGDKLTYRDNKNIRDLREILRHENIEVTESKPEIILRWQDNKTANNSSVQP